VPYAQGTRLPGESASKLGHLAVLQSEWVRALVTEFDSHAATTSDPSDTPWTECDTTNVEALRNVWAVDGSFVAVQTQESPPKEVAFVKTALLTVDGERLEKIDKEHPHPLLIRDVLTGSGIFHATVFPLKNIRSPLGTNYDAIRHIVRDSIKLDEGGAFYETLKWLVYEKWSDAGTSSLSFGCPHCDAEHPGLSYDADEGRCPRCQKDVFLTDVIGFHLDMGEESAPDSVASAYMLVMEVLMLFTAVRVLWQHSDKRVLSDTLFIKDGPLTMRGQYSKLVPKIRGFLQHAKERGRPVHMVGQEKTGTFVDHLASIVRFSPPHERGHRPWYAVLSHDYVRREVYRSPDLSNPYGMRTNWGEKVFVKFDPGTYMVINVPTGHYDSSSAFPTSSDLIGFSRILAALPTLVCHKHEGALFPIELANGIASMSSYPSGKILQRFIEDPRRA
jgi:hypothetical protein